MALITIATDNPEEAKRLIAALYGDPRQEEIALDKPAKAPRAAKKDAEADNANAAPAAPTVPTVPTAPAAPVAQVAPVAAPAPVASEPQPGWTLEHVTTAATQFVRSPKPGAGVEGYKKLMEKYGIERASVCPPGRWHDLYADFMAILEAN